MCGTTVTLRVDAPKTFAFDHVYAGGTQAAVYEDLGASARGENPGPRAGRGARGEVVADLWQGVSRCVIAYGAAGSGKTHTILGFEARPSAGGGGGAGAGGRSGRPSARASCPRGAAACAGRGGGRAGVRADAADHGGAVRRRRGERLRLARRGGEGRARPAPAQARRGARPPGGERGARARGGARGRAPEPRRRARGRGRRAVLARGGRADAAGLRAEAARAGRAQPRAAVRRERVLRADAAARAPRRGRVRAAAGGAVAVRAGGPGGQRARRAGPAQPAGGVAAPLRHAARARAARARRRRPAPHRRAARENAAGEAPRKRRLCADPPTRRVLPGGRPRVGLTGRSPEKRRVHWANGPPKRRGSLRGGSRAPRSAPQERAVPDDRADAAAPGPAHERAPPARCAAAAAERAPRFRTSVVACISPDARPPRASPGTRPCGAAQPGTSALRPRRLSGATRGAAGASPRAAAPALLGNSPERLSAAGSGAFPARLSPTVFPARGPAGDAGDAPLRDGRPQGAPRALPRAALRCGSSRGARGRSRAATAMRFRAPSSRGARGQLARPRPKPRGPRPACALRWVSRPPPR